MEKPVEITKIKKKLLIIEIKDFNDVELLEQINKRFEFLAVIFILRYEKVMFNSDYIESQKIKK